MSWEPLDQVYLRYAAGLNVSKLPRQQIIGEEMYNIKYKKEGESEYKNIDVHEDQFQKALRYIQTGPSTFKSAVESLQQSGLTSDQVQEILEVVYRYDNPHLFFNAIESKISIDEFLSAPGNDIIALITSRYNLEKKLVIDLLRFTPATQPVTGRGEIFIILFVNNARKGRVGDIEVNGAEFETKGTSARIRGQKGFGTSTTAKRLFEAGITKLLQQSKISFDINNPNFNINVNSNGFIDQIANELVATGNVTKGDIALVYAKGLQGIYENADIETDLLAWIEPSLTPNGNMMGIFKINYFLFAFKYYADQENFDYLVSIGTSPSPQKLFGKFNFISSTEIKSLSPSILKKIIPDSFPSFEPSAGLQGAFFSIKPVIS